MHTSEPQNDSVQIRPSAPSAPPFRPTPHSALRTPQSAIALALSPCHPVTLSSSPSAFRVDQNCLVAVLVVVEVRDARERILYSDSPVRSVEVKVRDVAFRVLLPGHVSNRIVPHACLVIKRIDHVRLPVDGIELGVSGE